MSTSCVSGLGVDMSRRKHCGTVARICRQVVLHAGAHLQSYYHLILGAVAGRSSRHQQWVGLLHTSVKNSVKNAMLQQSNDKQALGR